MMKDGKRADKTRLPDNIVSPAASMPTH